jgi:drug/metabolite transporter (DMT)-like permease
VRIDTKDNYKAGIFLIILSSLCFALIAAMVKQVGHLPVTEIILIRNIPIMIIIPGMIKKAKVSPFGNNKPILWFSGLVITIAMITGFYAYTMMPLTDAITIRNLSPFFTFFLAGIFLKEKLSLQQIPFFILAFLGGLLVIKPGFRIEIFPAIFALLSAIFIAASHTTLRHLRLTDHYLVIINYRTYINSLVNLTILILQKSFEIPSPSDLLILTLLGAVALVAQIAITKAYQLAPASLISLYNYSQIIFASLFALFFFKEIPDIFSIGGASFIIISGYLNYRYKSNN